MKPGQYSQEPGTRFAGGRPPAPRRDLHQAEKGEQTIQAICRELPTDGPAPLCPARQAASWSTTVGYPLMTPKEQKGRSGQRSDAGRGGEDQHLRTAGRPVSASGENGFRNQQ
jgi:hypothetical protein